MQSARLGPAERQPRQMRADSGIEDITDPLVFARDGEHCRDVDTGDV